MSELEIWNELGNIYYNSGAYDEAIRAYHRAIELDHCCGQSFSNLASIYIHKKYYAEAILMYHKGIELLQRPAEQAVLWNRLGDVHLLLDDYDEALKAYQMAVTLDPENEAYSTDLARVSKEPARRPSASTSSAAGSDLLPETVQAGPAMTAPATEQTEETASPLPVTDEIRPEPDSSPESPDVPLDLSAAGLEGASQELVETLPGEPPALPSEEIPASLPLLGSAAGEPEALLPASFDTAEPLPVGPVESQPAGECTFTASDETEIGADAILEVSPSLLDSALAEGMDLPQETPASLPFLAEAEQGEIDPAPLAGAVEVAAADLPAVQEAVSMPEAELLDLTPEVSLHELEDETAEKVATFFSDLPAADPSTPEPGTACWVFKNNAPAAPENEEEAGEKRPMVLGGSLLSDSTLDESFFEPSEASAPATTGTSAAEGDEKIIMEAIASLEPLPFKAPAFENPLHSDNLEEKLPPIEPLMGEPMNSRGKALLNLAITHQRRGDFGGALQFLKTAINLAAVFSDAQFEALCFYAMAHVETDLGKYDQAIQAHENAASLDPDHFSPWKDVGYLYSQSNRCEEALASFKKAIEHNPNDSQSWNGLGDIYHKMGRADDAISAYQLGNVFDRPPINEPFAVTARPAYPAIDNPRVLEEMGNIDFLNGAFEDAIVSYSNSIDLMEAATDKARLWKRVGEAHQRLEEMDEAEAAFEKAADLEAELAPRPLKPVDTGPLPEDYVMEELEPADEAVEPQVSPLVDAAASEVLDPLDTGEAAPLSPEPDPAAPAPTDEVFPSPDPLPAVTEPAGTAEAESPFWFFKSRSPLRHKSKPVEETTRPTGNFRLSADTGMGNVKPSPAFVLPKYSSQASLDKPLLADACTDVMLAEEDSAGQDSSAAESLAPSLSQVDRLTLLAGGEPETSTESLQQAQSLDQPEPALTVQAAVVEQSASDFHTLENDIAAYRKVTEINPLNDRAWDALGNMYEATGLHSEAIAAFEKAISLASQREVYHYHLGLAHAAQKHYDRAIQALQKVVAINPDYMLAHCALAGYYRRLGKEAEAREHIVIARPYMETENYYNQACFESICGNVDRAIAFLKNALDKNQVELDLVRSDPDLDFIRSDPRFEELLNRKEIAYQPVPGK
jgi:tetratricopeptide (TPR) repeat protein